MKSQQFNGGMPVILLLTVGLSYACTTTKTVQHNKTEGTLTLFSQTDPASTDDALKEDDVTENVLKDLEKRLEKNPKDIETALSASGIYLAMSNYEKSIEFARKALRFNLKENRARVLLAQNYYRLEKFQMAEIVVNSLPASFDQDPSLMNIKALIALKRGRSAFAWQLFKKATELHPENVSLAMNYGVQLLRCRQADLAEAEFSRVLTVLPKHQDARVHLAIIEGTRGNFDRAIEQIEELTDESNRLNSYNIAIMALAKKDLELAEQKVNLFLQNKNATQDNLKIATRMLEKISLEREIIAEREMQKAMQEENAEGNAPVENLPRDTAADELEKVLTH